MEAGGGAEWYEVAIFNTSFQQVAASGRLQGTAWKTAALEEGKVYLWQLTVPVGGRRLTAPRPPAPEARFVVLRAEESARLASVAARFPREHVLLGVLYARAGAVAEARTEWEAAVAEGHVEARKLLDSL